MKVSTVIVAAGALFLSAACKKPGVVEEQQEPPAPQAEIPVPQGIPAAGDPSIQPAPVRQVIDQDVGSRWKGVEITVAEKTEGGAEYKVEIALGGEADVEGTPLKIKLLGFVPDFSMGADSIETKSLDDVNPAAKIEVRDGEEVLFTGWSFRDFPGMHSFDDPRYTVQLSRAIPAE
ncbi:DUF2155 domain-containing protein [bacterium]|nr:DUF2155 domain-containing protein [bacterium]